MSNKKNKEIEIHDSESEEEQDSGSEKDSDFDSDGNFVGDKELQADFEGRNPEDCDFHGIKQLLRQLFLKSNVELSALAQIIISQNYVGSVVKQCLDDGQDEEDDEDDGSDGVFGITTIINITKRKDEACIQQIRTLLTTLADENADDRTKALVKKILANESEHVGLVINERILNIPAAISVPLFSSLQGELDKAIKKNMPYTFQYLIWICKTYNIGEESSEVLFANQEEKPIADEALASFEVDVTEQADLSQWDYEGGALTPCRKAQGMFITSTQRRGVISFQKCFLRALPTSSKEQVFKISDYKLLLSERGLSILIFDGSKFNNLVRLIKEEVEAI